LESGAWSQEMLDLFDIPRACLPMLIASSLTPQEAPHAEIEGRRVPITGIAGDQQAALFGQACFARGTAKNTYGTGCFVLMNTGTAPTYSRHRLVSTIAWERGHRTYALEGSVFVAGAVVQWLRDGLGVIATASEVEALAASVPDTGGVHFVPAFTGLGAPYWDPMARGAIMGLTRGTTRAHVARAALEAIAFQSAEVLQAMERDSGQALIELRVDGGASANNLLLQFQADLLGVPVVRPVVTETTALGAAYLAGLGAGYWASEADVVDNWRVDRRFQPACGRDWAQQRLLAWSQAVGRVGSGAWA
jgi:glycerol kinase